MSIRYSRWHHKKGANQASPEDLAVSRKVLGDLESQLAKGSVLSGARKVAMPNGTVISAAITMGVPSVTIEKQPTREGRPRNFSGDFVTTARTLALPDGHDPDHPQHALRTNEAADQWVALTYSGGENGARSDGAYVNTFPKGLQRAGNIDWVSAEGERISWYGPSSRMFLNAYIHPRHQFGKFVFFLGEPLLDVEQYLSDSEETLPEQYITGAGMLRFDGVTYLYCMQSTGPDGDTSAIPVEGGLYDYPLPRTNPTGGLHRYRLLEQYDAQGVKRYRVIRGSRQKILPVALGQDDVWFFRQDLAEMVCHAVRPTDMADSPTPWWAALKHNPDLDPADAPPDEYLPGQINTRYRVALFTNGENLFEEFSVVSGGDAVPLASDFYGNELREITIRFSADLVPYIGFDGVELPTREVTVVDDIVTATSRWVLYASPRDGIMVFMTENRIFDRSFQSPADATAGEGIYIETWVGGVQVNKTVLYPPAPLIPNFGLLRIIEQNDELYTALAGVPIAPSYFLYGVYQRIGDTFGPDLDPESWQTSTSFIGFNSSYGNLIHPSECWFGLYTPTAGGPQPIAGLVSNSFHGNQADTDGNFSVLGCATQITEEGNLIVLLSVGFDVATASTTFALATNATLSELTGVSGSGQRYHPLWSMGTIDVTPEL